jgi:hypothetical protein
MVIWYIFPVLVDCTLKNLATLAQTCAGHKLAKIATNLFPSADQFCHRKYLFRRERGKGKKGDKKQGDRIGRIFAYWAIASFRKSAPFFATLSVVKVLTKNVLG